VALWKKVEFRTELHECKYYAVSSMAAGYDSNKSESEMLNNNLLN